MKREEPFEGADAGPQLRDSMGDGNRVMTMREFHEVGPTGVAKVVPPGAWTYVSIDIDRLGPLR